MPRRRPIRSQKPKQPTVGGPLNVSIPPETQKQLGAITASAELAEIHLIDSRCQLNIEVLGEVGDEITLTIEGPQFRGNFAREPKILYCGIRAITTVLTSSKKPLASISAEYSLFYRLPNLPDEIVCSEDVAMYFAGRTGVFNAWPFFREFVFSMATKMGMPAVILPLFKLPFTPPVGTTIESHPK
jgi:hypothetical protein